MAAAQRSTGYQREVASRNVEAIPDAAEELLQSQGHATISAVAAQAGVSRVTVYAHFPDWTALLEAAVSVPCAGRWQPCRPCTPRTARRLRRWTGCSRRPGSTWRGTRPWPRRWPNCWALRRSPDPPGCAPDHWRASGTRAGRRVLPHQPARRVAGYSVHRTGARLLRGGRGRPDRGARRRPHPHHLGPRSAHRNTAHNGASPCATLKQRSARTARPGHSAAARHRPARDIAQRLRPAGAVPGRQ